VKFKKASSVKKARAKDNSASIAIASCVFIIIVVVLSIRFGGQRRFMTNDADRISAAANLHALPPGYQVIRDSDASNARAVWIDHAGAADDAHVLVYMIEKGDPSSDDLSKYYATHSGSPCDKAQNWHILSNQRDIRVVHTMCHPEGSDILEEQAIFRISPSYTALVDESAPKADFDANAFRVVVRTISYATGDGVDL